MELPIYNYKGETLDRNLSISDALRVETPNHHVIYLEITRYLAAQRQGTHKTKTRGQVRGSTRKLRKQKGTGFARIGDIKSPLLRGGGHAFALEPRSYAKQLTKKTKVLARRTALWQKISDKCLVVLEAFNFEKPSTKQYLAFLHALSCDDQKTLLVFNTPNSTLYRSSNNLSSAGTRLAHELNTYDILRCDKLLIFEEALQTLEKQLV